MDDISWSQHKEGRISSSRTKVTANAFVRLLEDCSWRDATHTSHVAVLLGIYPSQGKEEVGGGVLSHRLWQAVASAENPRV